VNWTDVAEGGFLAAMLAVGTWATLALRARRAVSRVYRCTYLIPDPLSVVSYRDTNLIECGQGVKLFVSGDCRPICPKHNVPMTRIS
jgi:hypothetical protein